MPGVQNDVATILREIDYGCGRCRRDRRMRRRLIQRAHTYTYTYTNTHSAAAEPADSGRHRATARSGHIRGDCTRCDPGAKRRLHGLSRRTIGRGALAVHGILLHATHSARRLPIPSGHSHRRVQFVRARPIFIVPSAAPVLHSRAERFRSATPAGRIRAVADIRRLRYRNIPGVRHGGLSEHAAQRCVR